jgi:hypothetical protein
MSSHVGVASCNDTRYVASADSFDNASNHTHHNYGYCGQEPMSIVNSSSFDATSNLQHENLYSSAISSQYMVPPHDIPMNERIGYDNANYLADCSQNSASYAKINAHNLALYFAHDQSRISKILARHSSNKTYDSAQHIANNYSRINENSAMGTHVNSHDSASYVALKTSQIDEDLAHARKPYGPSKWKVPAYHKPYPLHIDYLEAHDGWWVPNFYKFSGEGSTTAVEH